MAAMNEDLVRSFFQQVDGGRTPVERCSPGFTAYLPGSPPTGLEGLDQFEANIRSAFSNIEHPIEGLVGVGDDVAVRLRFEETHTSDRHPRHWTRPEVFDPDRFTPEREATRHHHAYLPFGGGPRACFGGHFALLEAVIATAMIVRAHRLHTPPGPILLATGVTLRPAAPLPCILLPAADFQGSGVR